MNEGGKRPLHGQERRRPVPGRLRCSTRSPTRPAAPVRRRSRRAASCSRATSSSTTWARTCSTTAAGLDAATGEPFPVHGLSAPFDGLDWTLNGGDGADNQDCGELVHDHVAACCPRTEYPQFASDAPAEWDDGVAGAFEPFDGTQVHVLAAAPTSPTSGSRGRSTCPAGGATLTFQTSYDLETDFDYLFVEAHTARRRRLDDAARRQRQHLDRHRDQLHRRAGPRTSTRSSTTTRRSNADGTCSPTGNSGSPPGEWNAATGRSAGWEHVGDRPLRLRRAGRSRSRSRYASDPGVQGVNAFVDDVQVSTGEGTTSFEDDADPLDGWDVPGAPEGSPPNPNDWERTGSVGFEEGAVVSTDDSLFFGFGFEGVSTTAQRNELLGRSIELPARLAVGRPESAGSLRPAPGLRPRRELGADLLREHEADVLVDRSQLRDVVGARGRGRTRPARRPAPRARWRRR